MGEVGYQKDTREGISKHLQYIYPWTPHKITPDTQQT